jgi:tetratricopeptide (TPR) repeat protein
MVKETLDFVQFLQSNMPHGLLFDHSEFIREPGEELKAYYYSTGPLFALFEGYSCPEDIYSQGYEAVKAYYKEFSARMGYEVDIPYRILDNTANSIWQKGNTGEAEEIFLIMIKNKPDRIDAYFRLGDLYSSTGEYKKSVEYYQKCLDLNPNITVAKIRMEQAMEKME